MAGDELDRKDRPTIRHLRIDRHEVRPGTDFYDFQIETRFYPVLRVERCRSFVLRRPPRASLVAN